MNDSYWYSNNSSGEVSLQDQSLQIESMGNLLLPIYTKKRKIKIPQKLLKNMAL